MHKYKGLLFAILLSLILGSSNAAGQSLTWQTFLGSTANDKATAITVDDAGQIYVVGSSDAAWGQPILPYSAGRDAFIAKYSAAGQLLWLTFLGGKGADVATAVAIGPDQKVYVVGTSEAEWGKPRQKYTGQRDIFIAQLNEAGALQWHEFFGSAGDDGANGVTVDADGLLYITGNSDTTWGVRPLIAHAGDLDAFVLKLNDEGRYQWHTFLGSPGVDSGEAIVTNRLGQIYVAGTSSASWGEQIINPHAGDRDAFMAKLDSNGNLTWNTFLGTATGSDSIEAMTLDAQGALYVAGNSWDSWGKPVAPFNGQGFFDAFAAKVTADGKLAWHTFMGSASQAADADGAYGLTLDAAGQLYVIGDSRETWGQPLMPFAGGRDVFVTRLNAANGQQQGMTFLGGADFDYGNAITLDKAGDIYAAGYSQSNWGQPLTAQAGGNDAFLVKLPACLPNCGNIPTATPAKIAQNNTTVTATTTAMPSATMTATPASSNTPLPTATNSPAPTNSPMPSPTVTNSPIPSPTATNSPIPSPTVTNSPIPSPTATNSPIPSPTTTNSPVPPPTATNSPVPPPTAENPILPPQATETPLPLPTVTPLPQPTQDAGMAMTATTAVSSGNLQLSLTALGYDEIKLRSPYNVTEYEFNLPEHWQFNGEPYIRMDVDFLYNPLTQTKPAPDIAIYGNIIVALDGKTQSITPIQSAPLLNSRFRVPIPLELLNNPEQSHHTLSVALDTSPNCAIPHEGRLVIHPDTTYISLDYDKQPLTVDLARYPYPFNEPQYQDSKPTAGQIWLILPAMPNEAELRGAVAVATRLGNLGLHVDGMTDQELLQQVNQGQPPAGHFIMVGTPDRNQMIAQLNTTKSLPTPFRQRQLNLRVEGPSKLTAGADVTYKLTVDNPTQNELTNITLSNKLPAIAAMKSCNPTCHTANTPQETAWQIDSLPAGGSLTFEITAHLAETFTQTDKLVNVAMIVNKEAEPLAVNASTSPLPQNETQEQNGTELASAPASSYFLADKGWAATESDGVVQGLTAPWNDQQAILIITGLSDEAVNKAGQAMGMAQSLAGLSGGTALIDQVQPAASVTTAPHNVDSSLAQLGYENPVLAGNSPTTSYNFDLPNGWRLLENSALELHFDHSQLINYSRSSLRVLFNGKPVAEMLLNQQTAAAGEVKVALPIDRARPGEQNEITVQARLEAIDRCADLADNWFAVDATKSKLNLSYKAEGAVTPGFEVFPRPFNQQANLADLLFVLPHDPVLAEWQQAIRLAATIGATTESSLFVPDLTLESSIGDEKLSNSHLIIIGRPSRNPLMAQVNDKLPQPFIIASDLLEQQLNEVILRLMPGVSLGVLEMTRSPYNGNQGLLVISGTTDEGVMQAGETLSQHWQRLSLGNLAFINGTEVNTLDTRDLTPQGVAEAVTGAVPELAATTDTAITPTVATTDTAITDTAPSTDSPTATLPPTRPAWLMPMMAVAALLVLATLALAFWQARR